MQIGMMNNPAHDPVGEVFWAAEHGFDFIDLTLEHPKASADVLDIAAVRAALDRTGLGIVGHTAPYLPFANAIQRLRAAAVAEVAAQFEIFQRLGATLVNVHPDGGKGNTGQEQSLARNAESFATLAELAEPFGIRVMIENLVGIFEPAAQMRAMLDAHPRLGWHYDIGHAQVRGNRSREYLEVLGDRLAHVHLSDNSGRSDDHLPLGVGRLDWKRLVRGLKRTGYDGRITLEVFADDRDYLTASQRKLRAAWDATPSS